MLYEVITRRRQLNAVLIERGIARGELPLDTSVELVLDLIFAPIYARIINRGEDVSEDYATATIDSYNFV